MNFVNNALDYANNLVASLSHQIMLSNIIHALGGFGLAIVLQRYTKGDAFLPVWIGWVLLIGAIILHMYISSQLPF